MLINRYKYQLIENKEMFLATAIKTFHYQYNTNRIYRQYVDLIRKKPEHINQLTDIPFLPIELYKSHQILCGDQYSEVFSSSGTTGTEKSMHYVYDAKLYKESAVRSFQLFYGNLSDYCFLALLPGYTENKNSSLIYMVNHFMDISGHPDNGFYKGNFNLLLEKLQKLEAENQKVILLGVTHALMDLSEQVDFPLKHTIILETGGMKGTRKEITREELHKILKKAFRTERIHSEYGMTELLSQAYLQENNRFYSSPWMKVMIRDLYDPYEMLENGKKGGINVIDLANYYSCSFIETSDIGIAHNDDSFEVHGRIDHSDIRGCNLLMEQI